MQDVSRREFMQIGSVSLATLQTGGIDVDRGSLNDAEPDDSQEVAYLIGPSAARPPPGSEFFEGGNADRVYYAYIYEETDTGNRYYISQNVSDWQPLTMNPQTQVEEVRVEDYTSFFDHTFARPDAPDNKNWIYTPADVTKFGSEIELASTTTLETTQHGNYPPGTESIAGGAFRLTGTPTAGDGRAGYFNDQNGFGAGEDATDSFIFLRKGGTDEVVHRENWNGYVPDSRVFVSDTPVILRMPHLFYGGGSVRYRALLHENDDTRLRTLHEFTPGNTPDAWADGPPFDQPNLPFRFETNSLSGGALRANAAHYERGESDAETRIGGEHVESVGMVTTEWRPIISWRKRSGWEMVNVKPLQVAVEAATNDVKLELQLQPVLDGSESFGLATHTSSSETSIEVAPNNNNTYGITTDGERRWVSYAIAGQGNQSGAATFSNLNFSLPNDQIVTLAGQSIGNNATVSGFVEWQEFF